MNLEQLTAAALRYLRRSGSSRITITGLDNEEFRYLVRALNRAGIQGIPRFRRNKSDDTGRKRVTRTAGQRR